MLFRYPLRIELVRSHYPLERETITADGRRRNWCEFDARWGVAVRPVRQVVHPHVVVQDAQAVALGREAARLRRVRPRAHDAQSPQAAQADPLRGEAPRVRRLREALLRAVRNPSPTLDPRAPRRHCRARVLPQVQHAGAQQDARERGRGAGAGAAAAAAPQALPLHLLRGALRAPVGGGPPCWLGRSRTARSLTTTTPLAATCWSGTRRRCTGGRWSAPPPRRATP